MRIIKNIFKAELTKMGDLITYRAFPTFAVNIGQLDPFLLLNHHGPQIYKPNNKGLPFGPHPHKGFETVTFIIKGDILHKDTGGHKSVIKEGGIQWMNAGSGIIHSEISSDEFKLNGGELEILQLWINLPSKLKNSKPHYVDLQKKDIPEISLDQGKVKLHLISGSWEENKGPVQSINNVFLSKIDIEKGGLFNTTIDPTKTIFLYIVEGQLEVNSKQVEVNQLVEFEAEGESIEIKALSNATILLGHAFPTREPVVAQGPFVMNSEEEINKAFQEYHEGKYGIME